MQQTATWNFPPAARLPELLESFGCADVIAPVDAAAFGKRVADLIRQGARSQKTRFEEEGTTKSSLLLSVLQNAPPSDRHTMVAAAAASTLLVTAGVGAVLLG
jgi:hypothetical protein